MTDLPTQKGRTVNDGKVKLTKAYTLTVKCGKEEFRHCFWHLPRLTVDLLLEFDFQKKLGYVLDFQKRTITPREKASIITVSKTTCYAVEEIIDQSLSPPLTLTNEEKDKLKKFLDK